MAEPHFRHLKAHLDQGVLVVTITDRQVEDDEEADGLRDELVQVVNHYAVHKVVIDFQNTEYISSVAFRPLLHLRRVLQEHSGRLMLCGLSPAIGDVFYTTRLISPTGGSTAPFEMEKDVAAAVAKLNQPVSLS
jgi:anti-anti-sigma factor